MIEVCLDDRDAVDTLLHWCSPLTITFSEESEDLSLLILTADHRSSQNIYPR